MKYYFLLSLSLAGCGAEYDLKDLKAQKLQCLEFKKKYDEVAPVTETVYISDRVKSCKSLGAWQ